MKTLDEVIKTFDGCFLKSRKEWCIENCPYLQNDEQMCRRDVLTDALHYLKAYKENQYAYEEGNRKAEEARERYLEAVKNCELAENKYKKLCEETSQELRNTSQITCPKCHSVFEILDDPDGDRQQLLKCQALLQDFYRNDPLTWDELKGMEGKPVWVEDYLSREDYIADIGHEPPEDYKENEGRWIICQLGKWGVRYNNEEYISGGDCIFDKRDYTRTWKAYRKER